MQRIILLIVLIFFTNQVSADLKASVLRCSKIKNDIQRLACYDRMTSKKTSIKGQHGKWSVSSETNPLNDSKTVTAILLADAGKSKFGNPVVLILRCDSNQTDAYISWNDYLGSEAVVTTRIGDKDAKTKKWSLSTDKQATFWPGKAANFIRRLSKSNKLVAQVTPYNESPVTAIFNTTGLAKAATPLASACGWSFEKQ